MTKRLRAQSEFLDDITKLLLYMRKNGFVVTTGEGERTQYQQDYYFAHGLSRVKHSRHQDRLAHDFNIYTSDGKWTKNTIDTIELLQDIGEYWEKLNPKNRWGGKFTIDDKPWPDCGHFERTE